MDEDVAWAIVGLALVVVEVFTGTFYLLVLGIAAFGAAIAAWLGQAFPVQAILGGVIAAAGCYGVHLYHSRNAKSQMAPVDAGQPASFETWLDRGAGRARVRYRGTTWEARIEEENAGSAELEAGANLYVLKTHGNTLEVTTRRPA